MKSTEKRIKLFKSQSKVLKSNSEIILLLAGRGVGKSTIASHFVLKQLSQFPDVLGFVGAPSYAQTNDLMNKITSLLADCGIPYVIGKQPPKSWNSSLVEHKNYLSVMMPGCKSCSQVRYGSLENYESHRGISIGWLLIDEAALIREVAYREVLLPALRGNGSNHVYSQLLLTTPKGISNWVSDMISRNDVETIRAASSENFIEFPDKKIEQFKQLMSNRQFRQEILGEIINVSSRSIFHSFSHNNVEDYDIQDYRWALASDQNVDPAVMSIIKYNKTNAVVYDEIYIEGGATVRDIISQLKKKSYIKDGKPVALFGDRSGHNRNVIVDTSYYQQLLIGIKQMGISVTDKTLRKNPIIYDSRELVNSLLEKNRMYVAPRCVHTITDFERAVYTEDFKTDKKSYDPHIAESIAYFVWKEYSNTSGKIIGNFNI